MAKRSRKVSNKHSRRLRLSKFSSRKTMKRTNKRKIGKYSSHLGDGDDDGDGDGDGGDLYF